MFHNIYIFTCLAEHPDHHRSGHDCFERGDSGESKDSSGGGRKAQRRLHNVCPLRIGEKEMNSNFTSEMILGRI